MANMGSTSRKTTSSTRENAYYPTDQSNKQDIAEEDQESATLTGPQSGRAPKSKTGTSPDGSGPPKESVEAGISDENTGVMNEGKKPTQSVEVGGPVEEEGVLDDGARPSRETSKGSGSQPKTGVLDDGTRPQASEADDGADSAQPNDKPPSSQAASKGPKSSYDADPQSSRAPGGGSKSMVDNDDPENEARDSISHIRTSVAESIKPGTLYFDVEQVPEEEGKSLSHVSSRAVPTKQSDGSLSQKPVEEEVDEMEAGERSPTRPEQTGGSQDPASDRIPRPSDPSQEKSPKASQGLSNSRSSGPVSDRQPLRGMESVNASVAGSQPGSIPRVKADEESVDSRTQKHSKFDNIYSEAPTQELSDRAPSAQKGSPRRGQQPKIKTATESDSKPTNVNDEDTTADKSVIPSAYTDIPKNSEGSASNEKMSRSSRPSFPSQTFYEQEENEKDNAPPKQPGAPGRRDSAESGTGSIKIIYDDQPRRPSGTQRRSTATEEPFVKDRQSHMNESTFSSQYPDSEYDTKNPSRSAANTTMKMTSSETDTTGNRDQYSEYDEDNEK